MASLTRPRILLTGFPGAFFLITVKQAPFFLIFVFMKLKRTIGCILLILCISCTKQPASFFILHTSDLHGRFNESMAGLAGYIREQQTLYGKGLLLFDTGDNLQGTPGLYYSSHVDTTEKHLSSAFFNWFPYTAVTVGNHDIEAGIKVFSKVYRQMTMPVLSANIVHKSSGEPFFIPYHVFRRKGYKIAVLGMITPHVTSWVPEWLRPGLDFHSITASAQYWVPFIQEKENPDLIIGLFHTGARAEAAEPSGKDNAALWIAENVPGIDLICYGHDHKPTTHYILNTKRDTVWLMNPGAHGKKLSRAKVVLYPRKQKKARITAELVDVAGLDPDPGFLKALEPYFQKAREYEQKPIAELMHTLESRTAVEGPSRWLDEVHRGHLELAGTDTGIRPDVSFASALTSDAVIEKGQLYMKDFFTWFPYENSLCIVHMSGDEIKQYLEYSCTRTAVINFDTAAGILYTIHRDRPEGERIEIHSMADGQAFVPKKMYRVVMNSYRAQGGGGHLFEGLGWDDATAASRIIWGSQEDMRTLFMQWEASRSPFSADLLNHWKYE